MSSLLNMSPPKYESPPVIFILIEFLLLIVNIVTFNLLEPKSIIRKFSFF